MQLFDWCSKKSQLKKVVCEVPVADGGVSTDLWAWRKYGQKPIKGSPYPRYVTTSLQPSRPSSTCMYFLCTQLTDRPSLFCKSCARVFRGYYKCSSLKACMARKLVERSPAKPGVLVVTYIAEHCHAVPTCSTRWPAPRGTGRLPPTAGVRRPTARRTRRPAPAGARRTAPTRPP